MFKNDLSFKIHDDNLVALSLVTRTSISDQSAHLSLDPLVHAWTRAPLGYTTYASESRDQCLDMSSALAIHDVIDDREYMEVGNAS